MALGEILLYGGIVIALAIGTIILITVGIKTGAFKRFPLVLPDILPTPTFLLPPGVDPEVPSVRTIIEAWIAKKWDACLQASLNCERCTYYTNNPDVKSTCSVDLYILSTLKEKAAKEEEMQLKLYQEQRELRMLLEDISPKLEAANRNFGAVAWLRKMLIGLIVFNSGTIVTIVSLILQQLGG